MGLCLGNLGWYVTQGETTMATPQLTFNTGQTAILMADFHREGMGDNPMVRERGTVQKARAVLEAARQAGVLVVYIVVNFRPGYPEISDRLPDLYALPAALGLPR